LNWLNLRQKKGGPEARYGGLATAIIYRATSGDQNPGAFSFGAITPGGQ
jgi:hypothetical protein